MASTVKSSSDGVKTTDDIVSIFQSLRRAAVIQLLELSSTQRNQTALRLVKQYMRKEQSLRPIPVLYRAQIDQMYQDMTLDDLYLEVNPRRPKFDVIPGRNMQQLTASLDGLSLKLPEKIETQPSAWLPSVQTNFTRFLCRGFISLETDISKFSRLLATSISTLRIQRNRTIDNCPLSTWCFFGEFKTKAMSHAHIDGADLIDELETLFPDVLSIHRLCSEDLKTEYLLIRPKCYKIWPGTPRFGTASFKSWLQKVALTLPEQGVNLTIEGDVAAFWAGVSPPKGYKIGPVRIYDSFNDVWKRVDKEDEPSPTGMVVGFVGQAHTNLNLTTTLPDGQRVRLKLCAACVKPFAENTLLHTAGNTLCCPACHELLFCACHICTDAVHKTKAVVLSCDHKFCEECLIHAFQSGVQSLSDFPPKCCNKALSIHVHRATLPDNIVRTYLNHLEAQDQRKNIICATKTCARKQIPHIAIEGQWGLCKGCLQLTCTKCEQLCSSHKADALGAKTVCLPTDEAFHELAKVQEWRACPNCKAMVERREGCNSIRCICGQAFCYTCGRPYAGPLRLCSCELTFAERMPQGPDPQHEGQGVQAGHFNLRRFLDCEHLATRPIGHRRLCAGCLQLGDSVQWCLTCDSPICQPCLDRLAQARAP